MDSDKIKVGIRVRPFNKKEKESARGGKVNSIVKIEGNQATLLRGTTNNNHKRSDRRNRRFTFDCCFDSTNDQGTTFADQRTVFNQLGADILDNAFKGYNACLFAYGQTGSGKSYTMMGTRQEPGVIPRLCADLFQRSAHLAATAPEAHELSVEVSYMEIYNERVFDLLDLSPPTTVAPTAGGGGGRSSSGLKVREHNILGPYVEGLSQLLVLSAQEIDDLIVEGNKSRTIASTNMNSESSRSHAVFTIRLTFAIKDPVSGVAGEKVSRISLVDLAGSERADKTGAAGERLKEGSNINKSLTTLGLVISKLAEQSASGKTGGGTAAKDSPGFVPYRDSILTWLLKDSLGGNSRTFMLATLSPAEDNFEETLSTLRYADRAKRITNHAVVNEDPNARLIRELKAEVERLKSMLLLNHKNSGSVSSSGGPVGGGGGGGLLLAGGAGEMAPADKASARQLAEQVATTEQLMEAMSLTRDQKLALMERRRQQERQQNQAAQEHRQNGDNGEAAAAAATTLVESGYFLVNLNADPSLSGLLVYHLGEGVTRVGSSSSCGQQQGVQLEGVGIRDEHCLFTRAETDDCCVWLQPAPDARTCVNGRHMTTKTKLKHGDRLLFGANHFYRLHCPATEADDDGGENQLLDWNAAQEELLREQAGQGRGLDDVMAKLEERYEREKLAALDRQRTEYEKQMKRMVESGPKASIAVVAATKNNEGAEEEDSHEEEVSGHVMSWLAESVNTDKLEDRFKKSLGVLRQSLVRANMMAREANQMSEELARATRFSVSLQIPPDHLSPNSGSGAFMTQPSILLSRPGEGQQVWPLEKMESRLVAMRELNAAVADKRAAIADIGTAIPDPFYEAVESHNLVGVANFYLSALFHGVAFEYYAPIISQAGTVAGKLLVEIQKLAGSFPADRMGHCSDDDKEDSEAATSVVEDTSSKSRHSHHSSSSSKHKDNEAGNRSITVGIKIKAIVGLPPALAHFVFCQYRFWSDTEYTVVPAVFEPRSVRMRKADTVDFKFDHCRTVQVAVDEDFLEHCEEGALSVQVFGHKERGTLSLLEQRDQTRLAKTLAARYSNAHPDLCWICFDMDRKCHHVASRWSELVRQLQLWVEIHEMDDSGHYVPVDIQPRDDVGVGGIFQLRHGQQRRVLVRIRPVPNSGNLPIVCYAISQVEMGSPVARSKLQRPLDSYQAQDLEVTRQAWALALARLKDFVDAEIHKVDHKGAMKRPADSRYEQALMDQKNCIIDELNAALVPEELEDLTTGQLGIEVGTPLIFINTPTIDGLESATELDDHLPQVGAAAFLPKELQDDRFLALPILKALEQGEVGCLAAWDSSAHNSAYLNRVTQEQERLFLTVRATVRIRDPLPLDLVLRKRICFSVYRRQSLVNRFRKSLGYSSTHLLKGLGVTYELVGSVPVTLGEGGENMAGGGDDERPQKGGQDEEDTFFDDYAKAVTSVETILGLERLRQEDLVLELAARSEAAVGGGGAAIAFPPPMAGLRKTLSIPNFGGHQHAGVAAVSSSTLSLNTMMSRHGIGGSLASLNLLQDSSSRRPGGASSRRSLGPPLPSRAPSGEENRKRLSLPSSGAVGGRSSYLAKNGALRKSMMILVEEEGGGGGDSKN